MDFCSLEKLQLILFKCKGEPEVTLKFKDKKNDYMIIKYNNYYTFQRCGIEDGSGEFKFKTFDELINTNTIDDINIKRDWNKLQKILIDEITIEEYESIYLK